MKRVKKVFGAVLCVIVACWVTVVVIDYVKAINDKKLIFCLKEKTKKYDDGTVYRCDGLGYKYFKYDRDGIKASQFGPFFIEEKTIDQLKAKQK